MPQGRCVEQLLYATAYAQWMPAMGTLLFPSTLSPGQNVSFTIILKLNWTKIVEINVLVSSCIFVIDCQ